MKRGMVLSAPAAAFFLAASLLSAGFFSNSAEAAWEDDEQVIVADMVRDIVRGCVARWSFSPPAVVELTLEIDADGKLMAVKPSNHVSTAAMACIEEGLSGLPFASSKGGRKVYTVVKTDTATLESWKTEQQSKAKGGFKDPGAGRMTFAQTAFQPGKGSLDFRFTDGSIFSLTCGITDNVSIMFNSVTPLGFWGLGVHPKVSFKLAPGVRLGFVLNLGFLWMFLFEWNVAFMYGGAPVILTLGSEDFNVTLSVHLDGITHVDTWKDDGIRHIDSNSYFFIVPDIGASVKIAPHVKLHVELWSMISTKGDWKKIGFNGRTWGIDAGCRIFWDKFYLDVGAVALVMPEWIQTRGGDDHEVFYVEDMIPGVGPMISFGFKL